MNKLLIYLVAVACLSLPGLAQAQDKKMYSWTDENGTVHFSDQQPDRQDAVEIDVPEEHPPSANSPYSISDTNTSAADQRRKEIAQKNAEAKLTREATSAQCNHWRQQLEQLEPNRRVFYTDSNGETVRMDDVERTNKVAGLKDQIANNCK